VTTRKIVKPVAALADAARRIYQGQSLDQEIVVRSRNEIGELANSFRRMLSGLREATRKNEEENALKSAKMALGDRMRGDLDLSELGRNIITLLAHQLGAQVGAFYVVQGDVIKMIASYALDTRKGLTSEFAFGEGLVGQVALDRKRMILTNVPGDYLSIHLGIGEGSPQSILVVPFIRHDDVIGVIELGSVREIAEADLDFLQQVLENIAIAVVAAESRRRIAEQSEALKKAKEELEEANKELQTEMIERERIEKALREAEQVRVLAETAGAAAHEINQPLTALLGISEHLKMRKEGDPELQEQLEMLYNAGIRIADIVSNMQSIERYETRDYGPGEKIVDFAASSRAEKE